MTTSRAKELVEELLELESRGDLLDHRFEAEQVLLWPLVRWGVLRDVIEAALQQPTVDRTLPATGIRRLLRYLASSYRRDPLRLRSEFDVLIFGSTVGISMKRDGKWFGRINDYFALEHEDRTLVLDIAAGRMFREPRFPRNVAAYDAIPLRAALRAGIAPASSAEHERVTARFVGLLKRVLPVRLPAPTEHRIARNLNALGGRLRLLREAYARLFDSTSPKIVFMEDASYGGQSYIFKWARELGVRTGEFQPGMIVPTHVAYNYGDRVRGHPQYRTHLPEFLLTYGKFWSGNTRTSSTLVEIGNPHFEARRAEIADRPVHPGTRVLMVSQPGMGAGLAEVAIALRARLSAQQRIVFRLHPNETLASEHFRGLVDVPGIQISTDGDIYELLHGADAVVGCWSTALFEAAGLGRTVYVYETSGSDFYLPRSFGIWFSTADELADKLQAPSAAAAAGDYYFERDWRARYRGFLEELGIAVS